MTAFQRLTPETMHRGAKLFMDRGQAATYLEALSILNGFRLSILVGRDVAASESAQVALLTAVNTARRSLLGGVEVIGCPDVEAKTALAHNKGLRESVAALGARHSNEVNSKAPLLLIGDVDPPVGGPSTWRVTWQGWAGGAAPAASGIRLNECGNMHLSAALAAALAVSEVFQMFAGDCVYAGRRTAGLSLWAPTHPWTDPSAFGPDLNWLPSRLWLIGLGNLGQAYLWCLGALPYVAPSEVRLVLQDDDEIQESNDSTSVLSHLGLLGRKKTRAMAEWSEGIGFKTAMQERRFGSWISRSDLADDPVVALCGVDNAEARMALEDAKFPLVVESGLGAGPQGYRALALHCFPGARSAKDIWSRVRNDSAAEDPSSLPAYQAAREAGVDPCGVLQLASRTVGVPFVGLTAAALVVAELLRRVHGGPSFDALAATVASLDDLECVPSQQTGPWLFGSTGAR